MADLPGNLSFASFVRQGLAAGIKRVDGTGSGPTTSVSLEVNFDTDTDPAQALPELALVGPGDIVGLDGRVVTRTWPKANENDAESGSLPLIEFDQADLPWRYTPARANASGQLRPWINLVVVEESEGTLTPPTAAVKQAILNTDKSVLPDLSQSWAWAHTQFAGQGVSSATAAEQIQGKPGLFSARLMCPRMLSGSSRYIACLVPTFERGRLTGIGEDPAATDALKLAWEPGSSGAILLPVYYFWRFQTGTVGSFRQLARLIEPTALPADIGRRKMDVQEPGLNLPPASTALPPTLDAEGALQSVQAFEAGPSPWSSSDQATWVGALKQFLNTPVVEVGGRPTKVVAPPLYGRWNAAETQLNAARPAGSNPPWFYQLNSDPRARVAGGLGTTVIQNNQQDLLASGWKQVGEVRAINQKLKVAQLGREVATRVFERHVTSGGSDAFWTLTGRLHAFGICNQVTMCQRFDDSPVGRWIFDPYWRRLSRRRGQIGVYQGRPELPPGATDDVVHRLNDNQRPAPEPGVPEGLFTPGLVSSGICFEGLLPEDLTKLEGLGPDTLLTWSLVLIYVARQLIVTQSGSCFWHAMRLLRFGISLYHIACSAGGTVPGDAQRRLHWCEGMLSETDIATAPKAPNFTPADPVPENPGLPPTPGGPSSADNEDAAAFRAALILLIRSLQPPPELPVPASIPDLQECRLEVIATITPQLTVERRFSSRLSLHSSLNWHPKDRLEPIFAPPTYEQPMYQPLSEISPDWILPGIERVGRNTAAIALTNQRFVEAYMVGLNHEMTRELQWNEFPVDQRATYFRQFWDITGIVPPEGSTIDPATLRDVLPISSWSKTSKLGGNSPRPAPPGGATERVVLVIKAQLIQRYPNLMVYAVQGRVSGSQIVLSNVEKHPVFNALIGPDVGFYGFDLQVNDARGVPGWFFVLAEQPGEPKFFVNGAGPGFVSPPAGKSTAGQVAASLFMNPYRIALHGSVLLPA